MTTPRTNIRPVILIPTYDNPDTIEHVVQSVRQYLPDVIVVDDGSGPRAQHVIEGLRERGLADVVRRADNGGKGAAVKTGLARAHALGFSHAMQVDADGQHAVQDIPRFLEEAEHHPQALILGVPQFDADAPKARLYGRMISIGFVHLETCGRSIHDPLCGFRVYPVADALRAAPRADRMEFDPEIAVRMAWQGNEVRNLPTRVRYIPRDQGGVSHFQLFRDNFRISFMHTRLMCIMIQGVIFSFLRLRRWRAPEHKTTRKLI